MRHWRHSSKASRRKIGGLVTAASAALALAHPGDAAAQTRYKSAAGENFRITEVAGGLENPWSLAFLPDGAMLVTERDGRLRRIRGGKLDEKPIAGTPEVAARGQGGLLDVALHPDFATNRVIYLSYSAAGEGGANTAVMRATLDGERLVNPEVIFEAKPKTSGSNHYGSRLLFAPDGTLFVTLGDRYSFKDEAQSTANHIGTVVRINEDGSVPKDNPFVGKAGAMPEIYSYGHRNTQGIALRPGTSEIWQHEHGPRGGDEVNVLKPGANYGWPKITYGVDYSGAIISDKTALPGMEQPVVYWRPSIAPSGMAFYEGDKFPKWQGDLFVGALARTHLRRLRLEGGKVVEQEELLADLDERVRDVRTGPDGFLYVVTDDSSNGRVLRLEPAD